MRGGGDKTKASATGAGSQHVGNNRRFIYRNDDIYS